MNGIKLGFSFVDLAKRQNKGIGSFRLKDKSSVKILMGDDTIDLYNIRCGRLLRAVGYKGENAVSDSYVKLKELEDLAVDPKDIDKAWDQALYSWSPSTKAKDTINFLF